MLQEGLEFKGPAPVPPSITEHPLFQDKVRIHGPELVRLSDQILGEVVKKARDDGLYRPTGIHDDEEVGYSFFALWNDELAEQEDPLEALKDGIEISIAVNVPDAFRSLAKRQRGLKPSSIQTAFDRYIMLAQITDINPEHFLTEKIGVKLEAMKRIAILIPHLFRVQYRREIERKEFGQIAIASYPLFRELGIEDRQSRVVDPAFGGWDKFWGWHRTNPSFFTLVERHGKVEVALSDMGQALTNGEANRESSGKKSSAMQKIWEWYVETVEERLLDEVRNQELVIA